MGSFVIGLAMLIATAASALATDVVKPFKAESDLVRYAFHYELLDTVLKRKNQAKIARVQTPAQLRALTVGQGKNWGDVKIFESTPQRLQP